MGVVSDLTMSNRRLRMRRLVLFFAMTGACCAQSLTRLQRTSARKTTFSCNRRNSSSKGHSIFAVCQKTLTLPRVFRSREPRIRSGHRVFCRSRVLILGLIAGRATIR